MVGERPKTDSNCTCNDLSYGTVLGNESVVTGYVGVVYGPLPVLNSLHSAKGADARQRRAEKRVTRSGAFGTDIGSNAAAIPIVRVGDKGVHVTGLTDLVRR